MPTKAVIISSGDELTTGRVVDTNSAVIAERLTADGFQIAAVIKVGDSREQLLWALQQARAMADVVIGTGGLGPTADDLTAAVVAEFIGRGLWRDETVVDQLKARFAARGLPWTENNLKQALFPEGATVIPNPVGTAPGFRVDLAPGKPLVWLPGVPHEMTVMLEQSVLPWLRERSGAPGRIESCTFKLYGLTESRLDDLVSPLPLGEKATLSFRAHFPDLSLRLTVRDGANGFFEQLRDRIRELLRDYIYAEGDLTLEEVVGGLLLRRRDTLALAESCTGGLISHRITRVAGSSAYFRGSVVAYANEAKHRFLGVRAPTLEKFGAVSRETALEMSQGARERFGATTALGVTGIAGPTGGSAEKPVGTVWIALSHAGGDEARCFQFHGGRERIVQAASQAALNWLRLALQAQAKERP
ncbi:MAG TPA: competence/damage-inducible protein A [candidate division Zixibacteria bacterium]|nr:competence/damage-inducible protein A [candidate division Zixibacteria bacterium]